MGTGFGRAAARKQKSPLTIGQGDFCDWGLAVCGAGTNFVPAPDALPRYPCTSAKAVASSAQVISACCAKVYFSRR